MSSQFNIEKPPAPKGQSYVLKSSEIQALFDRLQIETPVYIRYYAKSIPTVFECKYSLPVSFDSRYYGSNDSPQYVRIYIYVRCVDYKDKQEVGAKLISILNVEFLEWLTKIVSLPDNSTYFKKEMFFKAIVENGVVSTKYTPDF